MSPLMLVFGSIDELLLDVLGHLLFSGLALFFLDELLMLLLSG